MNYLLLIADIDEYLPFRDAVKSRITEEFTFHGMQALRFSYRDNRVSALCFGIGKVNAATAAALSLTHGKYDGVINTGWSGAVKGLHKGDIVVADSCVECDFDLTPIGKKPGEKMGQDTYIYPCDSMLASTAKAIPGFLHAKIGTGDFFLTDKARKDAYYKEFGIAAFDMESGAIASVCHLLGVPFVSIRKISDSADDAALSEYTEAVSLDNTAFAEIVSKLLDALSKA